MIPLYATNCERFVGTIAVRLAHKNEPNRAVHFGEKSDRERKGIKVVCTDLQTNSTDA
jgi:DNA/RNA-binding domain of Phe-tRNA-synthetase-like protein